jgi:hypothetical protein
MGRGVWEFGGCTRWTGLKNLDALGVGLQRYTPIGKGASHNIIQTSERLFYPAFSFESASQDILGMWLSCVCAGVTNRVRNEDSCSGALA